MVRAVLPSVGLALALSLGALPTRADAPPEIEIYRGTRKVSPSPKPPSAPAAGPKAMAAVAATLHDATAAALSSTSSLVGRAIDRTLPKWDVPRFPVVVNVTLPPPAPPAPILLTSAVEPRYLPWVKERPEPREDVKPTVVVIREPAPAAAAVPEVRVEPPPVRVSNEVLLLTGAVFGGALLVTVVTLLNRSRSAVESPTPVVTLHGLSAGEWPDLPEPFDVGPTFADAQAEKQAAEAAGSAAMLQHILAENVSLRTELAKA